VKRPLLRWFGGKFNLAPWIVSHFPEHRIYVEPYGGAGSVLLKKPRSYAEVWNDLNDEVFTLFWTMRQHELVKQLQHALEHTPYSRREFELAHSFSPDPIERSRRLIVRSLMGFGADSACDPKNKTGFRGNTTRSGSTPQHVWVNYVSSLEAFYERMKGVVIENRDALEVSISHDTLETLHYFDPPYLQSLRRVGAYSHEMDDTQHEIMLKTIIKLKGKVVLSGYANPLYEKYLGGWVRVERETRADKAGLRTEVLWIKP